MLNRQTNWNFSSAHYPVTVVSDYIPSVQPRHVRR